MADVEYIKRVMIFSPDANTQDYLEHASKDHFGSIFDAYTKKSKHRVEFQKFLSIGDSYAESSYAFEYKIGKGGEILALFDLEIIRGVSRMQREALRGLFDAEQVNCLRIGIPYGIYEKGRLIPLTWGNSFHSDKTKSFSDVKLEVLARFDAADFFELKPRSH